MRMCTGEKILEYSIAAYDFLATAITSSSVTWPWKWGLVATTAATSSPRRLSGTLTAAASMIFSSA